MIASDNCNKWHHWYKVYMRYVCSYIDIIIITSMHIHPGSVLESQSHPKMRSGIAILSELQLANCSVLYITIIITPFSIGEGKSSYDNIVLHLEYSYPRLRSYLI